MRCRSSFCRKTPPTKKAPSSRFGQARAARRRLCSRPIFSACISVTPTSRAGRCRCFRRATRTPAASREVVASISGKGVFARMKFESGVHRVQRVPETENQGRIHTSAATVAVLPEAEEIDIEIRAEDIRIDTMRASGAGGQHVNTTDSAVRITHIPTGMIVTSSEKSQHQNRARAMQVLRARLFDMERTRAADARAAERKDQIGSGDRSQRIRTYNFPQGRVTDHRVNVTLYNLPQIMEGEGLDTIIDALITEHQASLLASEDTRTHA